MSIHITMSDYKQLKASMFSAYRLELDFPMTADPTMDSYVRYCIGWACKYIIEYLGAKNLSAIILSGSFAQGQGAVLRNNNNGILGLLSDLDMVIVVNDHMLGSQANLTKINSELNSALNSKAPSKFLNPLDTTICTPEQAKHWWMSPCIATLQLAGTARVIWGDQNILPYTPPVSVERITSEEVFKLLNNRIAEQVFYFVRFKQGIDGPECFSFHSAKAAVDSVLAICISEKCFKSSLQDRLTIFEKLSQDLRLGYDMVEWAQFWTKYKITPNLRMLRYRFKGQDIGNMALEGWKETATFLLRALRWISKRKLGIDHEETDALVMQLAKHFGFSLQKRLWAKDLLRNIAVHPFRSLKYWRHLIKTHPCYLFINELRVNNLKVPSLQRTLKLSDFGSPSSLTYAVATLLLCIGCEPEMEQKRLLKIASEFLPTVKPIPNADLCEWHWNLCLETARCWNALVMNGRRNYQPGDK